MTQSHDPVREALAEECKRLAAGVRVAITRQCMEPSAKNIARCDLADAGLADAIDRLASSPAPAAEAGEWVMVPRVLTDDMLVAACKAGCWRVTEYSIKDVRAAYAAMIQAAPPSPQAGVKVAEAVGDAHEIALRSITWQQPRLEQASAMTGSPERYRCFHCGHAWQPDCKAHHDPDCAYMIAINALATPSPSPAAAQVQGLSLALRLAIERTRDDLGSDEGNANYPHVRELLRFAERAVGAPK